MTVWNIIQNFCVVIVGIELTVITTLIIIELIHKALKPKQNKKIKKVSSLFRESIDKRVNNIIKNK